MRILIPPPPPDSYRTAELPYVSMRYADPLTPRSQMSLLDENHPEYFSQKLVERGLPAHTAELHAIAKNLVPVILAHKNYFNSARPYQLAQRVGTEFSYDDLRSAQSPSYPSGHTVQAYVIALVLSEAYPQYRRVWLETAEAIAQSRIDRGVHVPSDNEGGKVLAVKLMEEERAGLPII